MQERLTVARAGERLAALERKVDELKEEYVQFGLYDEVYEQAQRGVLPPSSYPFYDDLVAANEEFEVLKGFYHTAQRKRIEHAQDLMALKDLEAKKSSYEDRKMMAFRRYGIGPSDIDGGSGLPKQWPFGMEMLDWDRVFEGKYGAELESLREKVALEDPVHEDRLGYAQRIVDLENHNPLLQFSVDGYNGTS